jgi:hypothetical protein
MCRITSTSSRKNSDDRRLSTAHSQCRSGDGGAAEELRHREILKVPKYALHVVEIRSKGYSRVWQFSPFAWKERRRILGLDCTGRRSFWWNLESKLAKRVAKAAVKRQLSLPSTLSQPFLRHPTTIN